MKDYSLKINGNQYDISIEDVNEESTMANVTVNGVAYEVEKRTDGTTVVRIATSWATREEDVAELLEELKNK